MKTFCIEVVRELEEKEILHFEHSFKPLEGEIVAHIKSCGYDFNPEYDKFRCYEVEPKKLKRTSE